jgi:uncharacterized membrane protein YkoI
MTRRTKGALVAAAIIALAGAGAGLATATGGGDDDATDKPIRGSALDRARSAALAHTGGGRVTETEVGDEEGYYEVEVTRADGSQVDVHLDRGFKVLGDQADDESEREDGSDR